jgi:hypothetical protein
MFEYRLQARRHSPQQWVAACAVVALAVCGAGACGARYVRSEPLRPSPRVLPDAGITRNVVVVSVDGLRPDAIGTYAPRTLQRLMREGSYTLTASTISREPRST